MKRLQSIMLKVARSIEVEKKEKEILISHKIRLR